jgi:hypothetical protein
VANPTSIDAGSAVVAASGSDQNIVLNPRRKYTLQHNGVTEADNADLSTIFCALEKAASLTPTAGANVLHLRPGDKPLTIGQRSTTLHFISNGTPTFTLVAGPIVDPHLF